MLVLDEPLSNLDAKVRLNVRHEIKSLQKRLGFTSLIVTHDQQEALVMADRIAVLNQGRIEQTGTPEEIYQRPATPFVADFMGADNKIISGELSAAAISGLSAAQQGDNVIYFRSADAALAELTQPAPQEGLALEGVVEQSAFLGNLYRHSVRCHDRLLLADAAQCWPTKAAFGSMCQRRPCIFSFTTITVISACSFWGQSMLTKTKAAIVTTLFLSLGAQADTILNVATAGDQNMVDYVKNTGWGQNLKPLIPASRCG